MHISHLSAVPVAIASALLARSVAAQERPQFPPSRDVVVSYRVNDESGRPGELNVAWSASLRALRAEVRSGNPASAFVGVPLPPGTKLVMNLHSGRAFAAEDRTGFVLNLPQLAAEVQRGERALASARSHRLGTERVAGLTCTVWRVEPTVGATGRQSRRMRVCVTPDGVPLRAQHEGRAAHMEATAVAYRLQDPALFEPPRGGLLGAGGDALGRTLGGLLGGDGQGSHIQDQLRGLLGQRP